MTRTILEKEGWKVSEAENGRAALECMERERPSLILLDLMMPEMDGFEFAARVRQHPEWRSIPIVVVTAKDLTAEERRRLNGYVETILQQGRRLARSVAATGARLLTTAPTAPDAPEEAAPVNAFHMPKILLVEDNEMNRDMLSRRLQRKGYQVVLAVDGQSGVEMAQTQAPDLVLMDMSLPVLDGWEATRRLKADAADTAHSRHRPHRARHVRRPRKSSRSRLRRLRHQAGRVAASARQNRGALERERRRDGFHRRTDIVTEPQLPTSDAARHALPSGLIHDLRTPLNQIIGYSEMLIEQQAQEQGQDDFVSDLQKIHAAGKQLLTLINDNFHPIHLPATRVAAAAPSREFPTPIEREPAAEAVTQRTQRSARQQGFVLSWMTSKPIAMCSRDG